MEKIINKIFPAICVVCGSPGRIICTLCLEQIDVLKEDRCIVCDKKSDNGHTHHGCRTNLTPSRLVTVFNYESVVREIIRSSKYRRKEFMALKFLISYSLNLLNDGIGDLFKCYSLIPVPPNPLNYKKRGFNQADIIANAVSKKFGSDILKDVLIRYARDYSQYNFNRSDRYKAVSGAFKVKDNASDSIEGKKLLLVDDIITSGATLLELSKTLYLRGAADVICFSLSRKTKD